MADENVTNEDEETPVEEPATEDAPVAADAAAEVAEREEAPTEVEEVPAADDAPEVVETEEATVVAAEAEEPVTEAPEAPEPVAEAEPDETEPAEAVEAETAADAPAAEAPAAEAPPAPAPQSGPKPKGKRLPRALRRQRPKVKRVPASPRKPITRLPKPDDERGRRQERQGTVVSNAMDKTIVVRVEMTKAHPKYKKVVRRSVKFHAHDEENTANVGDIVRIVETRPLSATKHWRLAEIVEAAK
jgi:small subunit ribosomal protein S17